ncbi:MAG: T9SS type A sorting domain-containing protein, partial [Crocinitomicaceae bacterium]
NPVEDILTIENLDSEFPIEIVNTIGQKVWQGKVNDPVEQINCGLFQPGIYTLKNGSNIFKFMKL